MTELKPCPCGHAPLIVFDDDLDPNRPYTVLCSNGRCAWEYFFLYQTEADAIEAWNTRPIEDALTAERDLLRKALEEIQLHCKIMLPKTRQHEGYEGLVVFQIATKALRGDDGEE